MTLLKKNLSGLDNTTHPPVKLFYNDLKYRLSTNPQRWTIHDLISYFQIKSDHRRICAVMIFHDFIKTHSPDESLYNAIMEVDEMRSKDFMSAINFYFRNVKDFKDRLTMYLCYLDSDDIRHTQIRLLKTHSIKIEYRTLQKKLTEINNMLAAEKFKSFMIKFAYGDITISDINAAITEKSSKESLIKKRITQPFDNVEHAREVFILGNVPISEDASDEDICKVAGYLMNCKVNTLRIALGARLKFEQRPDDEVYRIKKEYDMVLDSQNEYTQFRGEKRAVYLYLRQHHDEVIQHVEAFYPGFYK